MKNCVVKFLKAAFSKLRWSEEIINKREDRDLNIRRMRKTIFASQNVIKII